MKIILTLLLLCLFYNIAFANFFIGDGEDMFFYDSGQGGGVAQPPGEPETLSTEGYAVGRFILTYNE